MAPSKAGEFSTKDIPSLAGLIALVTGGSDGIGYETTLQLAVHGARVYILSRSPQKAADAIAAMKASTPDKELDVRFLQIDLQSLGSVDEAARKFKATESRLHILVANAGVSFLFVSEISKIGFKLGGADSMKFIVSLSHPILLDRRREHDGFPKKRLIQTTKILKQVAPSIVGIEARPASTPLAHHQTWNSSKHAARFS